MPAKIGVARRIAFDVLQKVENGAFASDLLVERTVGLDSRDAGLAAEITLGVLRRQGQLDFLIESYSGRKSERLDAEVSIALRMAVYQLRFLDRVPAYAAVNDSVNLLRAARKLSAVGFANAVLRKASGLPIELPDQKAVPDWLLRKWEGDFGADLARGIAESSLQIPQLFQHVPAGAPAPSGGRETDVPGCWRVDTADPRYRVQDIGSQAIVPLLELHPDHLFLDLCAAPGNKTAQAIETVGHAVASDVSFNRITALKTLGLPLMVLDATAPLPFSRMFDRILVDAPCTGTGTLGHNPEIKWRLRPADLPAFARKQAQILNNAVDRLAPGGLLVYSTCSLEPEENEAVARLVAGSRIQREIRRLPGRDAGDGFYAAVIR